VPAAFFTRCRDDGGDNERRSVDRERYGRTIKLPPPAASVHRIIVNDNGYREQFTPRTVFINRTNYRSETSRDSYYVLLNVFFSA